MTQPDFQEPLNPETNSSDAPELTPEAQTELAATETPDAAPETSDSSIEPAPVDSSDSVDTESAPAESQTDVLSPVAAEQTPDTPETTDTQAEPEATVETEENTEAPAEQTDKSESEAATTEPAESAEPASIKFTDFNLKTDLQKALDEVGYASPTPIQARTIPHLLQGNDVIGCAQTGTGKTAAFAIPVLEKLSGKAQHPEALIITPTRELAEQIFQNILDYSRYMPTRSVVIYGGVPSRSQESQLKKGCDIIIATPGRLLDLLNQRAVRLYDIKFLILDEADRMLDMGFIPDIENIMTYVPRKRQTLLFSATMPPEIEKLARKITVPDAEMIVEGIRSSAAETITQKLYHVQEQDKFPLLLDLIRSQDMTSTIIFSRTKVGTANLAKQLINNGIPAATIHSNLTQTQRQSSLDGFKRGDYKILVATDIAARGLDITQVSHVINYDTPTHPEDYVHRIGRTGRAQSTGEAYTFCSPEERKYLRNIERLIGRSVPVAESIPGAKPSRQSEHGDKPSRRGREDRHQERQERYEDRREDRFQDRSRDEGRKNRFGHQERPERNDRNEQTERPAKNKRDRHERPNRQERPEPTRHQKPGQSDRITFLDRPLHLDLTEQDEVFEPKREQSRRGKHENRMKENPQARRPQHDSPSEPAGQAALTEVRKARKQPAYELPAAPVRRANGMKPTEFFPGQGRQRQADEARFAQPMPEAAPVKSPRQAAQQSAYHASRFMSADDVDYLDEM